MQVKIPLKLHLRPAALFLKARPFSRLYFSSVLFLEQRLQHLLMFTWNCKSLKPTLGPLKREVTEMRSKNIFEILSPQTDRHGWRDPTYHQHLQVWRGPVHVCGQEPFWNVQQHRNTCRERYLFLFHRFWILFLPGRSFKTFVKAKKKNIKIPAQAWNREWNIRPFYVPASLTDI